MLGRSFRSIVLRIAFCLALAIALWCRSQVADDKIFVQYPGAASLEIDNALSGITLQLQIPPTGWAYAPNRLFACEDERKYRALWRHVYFTAMVQLWDSVHQGIPINSYRDSYTNDVVINASVPHLLLAIFLLLVADFEAAWRNRRRRHSPGLCQMCGYDVRGNSGRCSECGTPIQPSAVVMLDAKIRRYSRRTAGIFAVGILALHAMAGFTRLYTGYLSDIVLAADSATFRMLKFPVDYLTPPSVTIDAVTSVLLFVTFVINCLFWGWAVGCVARLALQFKRLRFRPSISALAPHGR